jgi:hypothetical protein
MTLWETDRRLLAIHLAAPYGSITATEMAHAAFGEGTAYGAANLHYGKLAKRLAQAMHLRLPDDHDAVSLIATFDWLDERECLWTMRHSLVHALGRVGIMPAEADVSRPAKDPA